MALPPGLHGAHRRTDLIRLLGPNEVRRAVDRGSLVSFARGVLVDARSSTALLTRAAAAQLYAGPSSVLTGFTALLLYGCSAPGGPIEVLVPYHRRPSPRAGVLVRHGRFTDADVCDVSGLRVIDVCYALAEVLCRRDAADALACADQVLARSPEGERDALWATIEDRIQTRLDPRGRRRGLVLLDLATGRAGSSPTSSPLSPPPGVAA